MERVIRTLEKEYQKELDELADSVISFLLNHQWCLTVEKIRLTYHMSSKVAVFIVGITREENSKEPNDLWIIAGDIPTVCLERLDGEVSLNALETYIDLMRDWVECYKEGGDLSECYPIEVKPSDEIVEMLESRMDFIEDELL